MGPYQLPTCTLRTTHQTCTRYCCSADSHASNGERPNRTQYCTRPSSVSARVARCVDRAMPLLPSCILRHRPKFPELHSSIPLPCGDHPLHMPSSCWPRRAPCRQSHLGSLRWRGDGREPRATMRSPQPNMPHPTRASREKRLTASLLLSDKLPRMTGRAPTLFPFSSFQLLLSFVHRLCCLSVPQFLMPAFFRYSSSFTI